MIAAGSEPKIVNQPESEAVAAGRPVDFSVVIAPSGYAPIYQWYFNDKPIPGEVARRQTYTFTASASRVGTYHVVVSYNIFDHHLVTRSDPASFTLLTRPKATLQPRRLTLADGSPLSLTATVTGTPAPVFQWFLDGEEIPGATAATFNIDAVDAFDTGAYTVRVTNAVGAAFSAPASVVVRSAPGIASSPEAVETVVGTMVRLRVIAMGFPKLSYQWRFNGEPIPGSAARAAMYSFKATLARAGTYDVVVRNALGEATSDAAAVVVNAGPKIVTGPVGAKLRVGQTKVFSVSATGFPAPSYQWLKNGEPIEGAVASTLPMTALRLTDAGDYSVRITNASGFVTSKVARLAVGLAPYAAVLNASFRLDGFWSSSRGTSGTVNEVYTIVKDGRLRFQDFIERAVFGFTLDSFVRTSASSANLRASTVYEGLKVNVSIVFTFVTPSSGTYTLRASAPDVGYTANQSGGFTYSEPGL